MIAATNLLQNFSQVSATSQATASYTPGTNHLILASILTRVSGGTPNIPTASGNSLTWVGIANIIINQASSNKKRLTIFRALGASPTTGALTFDFAGQTQTNFDWVVDDLTGMDTSGTNGSGAIVQSVTKDDGGTAPSSLTVTLAAFSDTNNSTYGSFANDTSGPMAAGTGFTMVGNIQEALTGLCVGTEFEVANNTSVVMNNNGATASFVGIGIEIKIAAAGSQIFPTLSLMGVGV